MIVRGRAGSAIRRRLWAPATIRARLRLVAIAPTLGLLVLTAVQARESWSTVEGARRAASLATTATAATSLLHQLEREQAETVALSERGGTAGAALVEAQRQRTDVELAAFAATVTIDASDMTGTHAVEALSTMDAVRASVLGNGSALETPDETTALYVPIEASLIAMIDDVASHVTEPRLAGQTRAIAALAAAKHAFAGQRDLLRSAYRHRELTADQFVELASLASVERQRLATFSTAAAAEIRHDYEELVSGPDVDTARQLRDVALKGPGPISGDSDAWYVASSQTLRRLHELELRLADDLAAQAAAVRMGALETAGATIGVAGLLTGATILITILVGASTSRRLHVLHHDAKQAAEQLPQLVAEISASRDPYQTHHGYRWRVGDPSTEPDPRDEVDQVATAIATIHTTALGLAADQALLRVDIATLVVALARRSQALVQQQLRAIDTLERDETDPDVLDLYYQVDHLAARMRRNHENLLVLAGAGSARRFATSPPLLDVLRAASAEIEHYVRVRIADVPPVGIVGDAVADVVHLLAELLENATAFSPPTTTVTVTASRTVDALLIAIYDDGLGLRTDVLATLNARLRQPGPLTSTLASGLGLPVVARLAHRHRIWVELRSTVGIGTIALVNVPGQLITTQHPKSAPLTTTIWNTLGPGSSARAEAVQHAALPPAHAIDVVGREGRWPTIETSLVDGSTVEYPRLP